MYGQCMNTEARMMHDLTLKIEEVLIAQYLRDKYRVGSCTSLHKSDFLHADSLGNDNSEFDH